ncbi:LysE family translocator [Roseospira goensis]|uniref:Threonine/homoserine/homoserine lactone efflux protein n=1 Tax=Roseospira goensis TaxID=391922 RepID=A0A7W6WLX6_9PROT|nr:LysE family transporter [Roseospira goensis]MBB4287851.1 threonine/homoserine/homoserine lactone efflux protein [Roseospira goensis]
MTEAVTLLWLAALPLVGTPGPATLSLAAMGAAYGVRASLGYYVGIVGGTAAVIAILCTGVMGTLALVPGVLPVLTGVAVAYILYLAWRIATAPPLARRGAGARPPSLGGGLLFAVVNPKAWAAFGALVTTNMLLPADPLADAVAKVVALTVLLLAIDIVWLSLGAGLARTLGDPRRARAVSVTLAVLLVGAVVLALWPEAA